MFDNRGFVSVYILYFLITVIGCCAIIVTSVHYRIEFLQQLEDFREMNWLEVMSIHYVKEKMWDYDTKDTTIRYDDATIQVNFNEKGAKITIHYNDMIRERMIEYDEIDDLVESYH